MAAVWQKRLDKLREVVERSRLRSAVYDVFTHGVPVSIDVTTG